MVDFSSLKKSSNNTSGNLEKLSKALESLKTTSYEDNSDKFWKPEVDKSGNGMAVIRFLPAPGTDGDDALPWVKIFHHGFQGPGGWFIDNCLTTRNEQCPVCEANSVLWNSGVESNKNIVRDRKRRLSYISNIYVISDPKHPENEGKVFLYKFGKKIFDKITEAMNPAFEDETPINPFDLWFGADFKLKIRKVDGYQNYDKSEFDSQRALFDDDNQLKKVWEQEHSLLELVSDKEFKSYDQLKNRLDKVLGQNNPKTTVEKIREDYKDKKVQEDEDEVPWDTSSVIDKSTDDEDSLEYFSKFIDE